MKKSILLMLIFVMNYLYSQTGWHWANPYPTPANLTKVDFVSTDREIFFLPLM